MKKGLLTFDKVMKDRARARRVAYRGRSIFIKPIEVPKEIPKSILPWYIRLWNWLKWKN